MHTQRLVANYFKSPSILFHKLGRYGLHSACLQAPVHRTRLFPHPLFHRGLWPVPHLPSQASSSVVERASRVDHTARDHGKWLLVHNPDGRRPRGLDFRRSLGKHDDIFGHGRLHMVVDWVTEVQKRDSRALGPCQARYPAALGLIRGIAASATLRLRFW